MKLNNTLVIKITDEMKDKLQGLADEGETQLSTFIRGQLEFCLFLWLNNPTNGYFNALWDSFILSQNALRNRNKQ